MEEKDKQALLDMFTYLCKVSNDFQYSIDEEDTYIEEISKSWRELKSGEGELDHIPQLAILRNWSNERSVIPLAIVREQLGKIIGEKVKIKIWEGENY